MTEPLITNADRLRWQRRAVALLGELLARAAADDLPGEVRWTIAAGSHLVGTCVAATSTQRRADWDTWRYFLAAEPWPEYTSNGRTPLHAIARRCRDTTTNVAILADLWDDED